MKDADNSYFETYKAALDLLYYEGRNFWTVFGVFFVPQSILMGFALKELALNDTVISGNWGLFIISFTGFFTCLLWFFAYRRAYQFYCFRMAQAREWEKLSNLNLLQAGQLFANGNEVTVDGDTYQMLPIPTGKYGAPSLIAMFILGYVILGYLSQPFCPLQ